LVITVSELPTELSTQHNLCRRQSVIKEFISQSRELKTQLDLGLSRVLGECKSYK